MMMIIILSQQDSIMLMKYHECKSTRAIACITKLSITNNQPPRLDSTQTCFNHDHRK